MVSPASISYDNTAASSPSTFHASTAAAAAAGGVGDVCTTSSTGDTSATVSVQAILQAAKCVLSETLVRKVNAVYQFQLHGEGGSMYYLDLKHGK